MSFGEHKDDDTLLQVGMGSGRQTDKRTAADSVDSADSADSDGQNG